MKLTLQIKLLPDDKQSNSLLQTIKECNRACNEISEIAWSKQAFNQYKLHRLAYHSIKKSFKLSAQTVVRCISKVVDAYKKDKKIKRQFRPLGAITYDTRILSYKGMTASVWSVDGRLKIPFICHNPKYLPYIKGEADLVYKKGKFYLFQTVEIPEEDIKDVEEFIGVDFGIVNLATTSNGDNFSGKQVDNVRKRMTKLKKALQKCGSKSAKRHLKKLSGKERRFKKNTNHTISKQIVQIAKDTNKGIALENLKGFKVSVRKEQRKQFGKWAFDELGNFIAYKARLNGISVIFVNPRNTSRTCSKCGYISKSNRKSQSVFVCQHCGFSINADINGAINIASRASVNKPIAAHISIAISSLLGTASSRL
ncbi:MAG: transposase [Bacteroidetes bacterium]|nr:transposase [Bacteroidota bacterium]